MSPAEVPPLLTPKMAAEMLTDPGCAWARHELRAIAEGRAVVQPAAQATAPVAWEVRRIDLGEPTPWRVVEGTEHLLIYRRHPQSWELRAITDMKAFGMRVAAIALAQPIGRYMIAVSDLFDMRKDGPPLAERRPTKDADCYEAFVELNEAGKQLKMALAILRDSDNEPEAGSPPVLLPAQPHQGAEGETVYCSECGASELLPYTDETKSHVSVVGRMEGWTAPPPMCAACSAKKSGVGDEQRQPESVSSASRSADGGSDLGSVT